MPSSINIPANNYAPGSYVYEIDTPVRASSAQITLTRERINPAAGWPDGALFNLRIYERDRGDSTPHLIFSCQMDGGFVTDPRRGDNFPATIGLQWASDKDKDLIRFEADVLQTFRTAITLEFV